MLIAVILVTALVAMTVIGWRRGWNLISESASVLLEFVRSLMSS
jgi:hypothetical protein